MECRYKPGLISCLIELTTLGGCSGSGDITSPISRTAYEGCGDSVCDVAAGESCDSCPSDCGECRGSVAQFEVYGPTLVGNLEGDSPTRSVFIYLPPSY